MQNKSPLRFTKTTPYDIYYKDIVPNQHLKTLSGG